MYCVCENYSLALRVRVSSLLRMNFDFLAAGVKEIILPRIPSRFKEKENMNKIL